MRVCSPVCGFVCECTEEKLNNLFNPILSGLEFVSGA